MLNRTYEGLKLKKSCFFSLHLEFCWTVSMRD